MHTLKRKQIINTILFRYKLQRTREERSLLRI